MEFQKWLDQSSVTSSAPGSSSEGFDQSPLHLRPTQKVDSCAMGRPALDGRSYRVIRLSNQLEALIIHDPNMDKASAALDVNVGSFRDDEDMPGMAHAVEHLLFMGTEQYPKENAYDQYLQSQSDYPNACTVPTSTGYQFEVSTHSTPPGRRRSPTGASYTLDVVDAGFDQPANLEETLAPSTASIGKFENAFGRQFKSRQYTFGENRFPGADVNELLKPSVEKVSSAFNEAGDNTLVMSRAETTLLGLARDLRSISHLGNEKPNATLVVLFSNACFLNLDLGQYAVYCGDDSKDFLAKPTNVRPSDASNRSGKPLSEQGRDAIGSLVGLENRIRTNKRLCLNDEPRPDQPAALEEIPDPGPKSVLADDPYAFLNFFDTKFLMDDSSIMAGRSWRDTQHALELITPITTAHDADGVDVYFLNQPDHTSYSNMTSPSSTAEIFRNVRSARSAPTSQRLNKLFQPSLDNIARDQISNVPLDIVAITAVTPSDDVESALVHVKEYLDRHYALAWQLGIQFFSPDNKFNAWTHLRQLDDSRHVLARDKALYSTLTRLALRLSKVLNQTLMTAILLMYMVPGTAAQDPRDSIRPATSSCFQIYIAAVCAACILHWTAFRTTIAPTLFGILMAAFATAWVPIRSDPRTSATVLWVVFALWGFSTVSYAFSQFVQHNMGQLYLLVALVLSAVGVGLTSQLAQDGMEGVITCFPPTLSLSVFAVSNIPALLGFAEALVLHISRSIVAVSRLPRHLGEDTDVEVGLRQAAVAPAS